MDGIGKKSTDKLCLSLPISSPVFGGTASKYNDDYWSPDCSLCWRRTWRVHVSADKSVDTTHSFDASEFNLAAQLFLGLGGLQYLSRCSRYRHIFTGDLDADIIVEETTMINPRDVLLCILTLTRWLW